ncbi:hypothetical protein [Pectobacterium sp. LFLA-215]|uniref:hypothetical protein n=1 Tax=Pectobacterium sp. LFLA-215 TaxID=3419008 RepID=UPI003F5BD878
MIKKIPLKIVYALAALLVVYTLYILMPVFRGYAFAYASCSPPNIIPVDNNVDESTKYKWFFDDWKNKDAQEKYDLCMRSYIGRFGLK